jgi:uncharacterized membrane protein YheB (UPF0754 family)
MRLLVAFMPATGTGCWSEIMVLLILPFISAAIGWFTNYVAIKMLFHPRKERDYYLFKLHGIFPKRKSTLAARLGRAVSRDLLSMDMLLKKLDTEQNRANLKETLLREFEDYLVNRFRSGNPMLAMLASDSVIKQVMQRVDTMLDELIPKMFGQIGHKLNEVDIERLVYEKVMDFYDEKFENLLMSVINKELRFIEVAGAVLGFAIGVIQVALVYLSEYYGILN